MANTTFNGPVRSENGFQDITKNALPALNQHHDAFYLWATITVADGATTGKDPQIGIPDNLSLWAYDCCHHSCRQIAVTLVDIGTDATDGFVEVFCRCQSTGFKGFFPCNGVLGYVWWPTTALQAQQMRLPCCSGNPGGDTVIVLKFFGISSSSDASPTGGHHGLIQT